MEFLYEHTRKHRKTLKIKTTSGYYKVLSPEQLLCEIENETEIGLKILNEIKSKQDLLDLMP